ncbi:MAG: response regulator [Clostridia bacterium]|nr:response regulator [Clostridia bacterium]
MGKTDILIVDDQLGVRSLLSLAFGDLGYLVDTADNGEEGVKKTLELRPRLVIMDIKMPVKDGITALYEIKGKAPDTMVMMMTAYGDADTIEHINKGGALGCIPKPFDIEDLIRKVDKLLREKGEMLA